MYNLTPISSALAGLMIAAALSACGGGKAEPANAPVGSSTQTTKDPVAGAAAAATKAAEEAAAATKAAEQAAAAEAAAVIEAVAATKAAAEAAATEAAKVTRSNAASEAKAAAAAKKAAAAASASEVFKMPSLVGENLQLAQDKLQALGSYVLDQEDAAGLGRMQVLDSNWQVCEQNPAPGKTVPVETIVLLTSVKLAEQCP